MILIRILLSLRVVHVQDALPTSSARPDLHLPVFCSLLHNSNLEIVQHRCQVLTLQGEVYIYTMAMDVMVLALAYPSLQGKHVSEPSLLHACHGLNPDSTLLRFNHKIGRRMPHRLRSQFQLQCRPRIASSSKANHEIWSSRVLLWW